MPTTPTIDTPLALQEAFAARFNARDLDGLLDLAEPDSAFVPEPGLLVTGEGYRAALVNYLSLDLPITLTPRHQLISGDLALLVGDWTIDGTGPDGSAVHLAGSTADVARHGDRGWRFVIDNPFGTA